jgi:23S rRNA (uracil-5-)-methyltransferase RumA
VVWTINNNISDMVQAEEMILLRGKDHIEEQMQIKNKLYRFIISPFSFFQTNTFGAEKLYETVAELLEPAPNDNLLDLYCGTGTIGLTIAPFVSSVVGVEQVSDAIKNAEENKRLNSMENISFETGSVEKWITHGTIPTFNSLIMDPPRSGISNKVVEFLAQTKPKKMIYVSCNPATLARDLHELEQKAGYRAQQAVAMDMFPQTFHVETVVQLQR